MEKPTKGYAEGYTQGSRKKWITKGEATGRPQNKVDNGVCEENR